MALGTESEKNLVPGVLAAAAVLDILPGRKLTLAAALGARPSGGALLE